MNINTGLIRYQNYLNPLLNNVKPATQFGVSKNALTADTFQKSKVEKSDSHACEEIGNRFSEQKIRHIFDEVYSDVIKTITKSNPVLNEIRFKKPEILFSDAEESSQTQASYSFNDNVLKINKKIIDNDYFLICQKDENASISEVFWNVTFGEDTDILLGKIKEDVPDAQAVKLTDDEKELYLRSVFAHELRHFVQSHLMASTDECYQIYKDAHNEKKKQVYETSLEIISLSKEIQEIEPDFVPPQIDMSDFSYALNYKPQKILDKDTTIKFSILPDDTRFLSVRNNLLPDEINGLQGIGRTDESSYEEYLSSMIEIDAFNFQSEYLLKISGDENKEVRNDVLCSLYSILCSLLETGLAVN